MQNKTSTIGKREVRKDAWQKVDGSGKYTADIPLPDKKFGVVVRSIHHHARILGIDASQTLGMQGVLAVITSADVPGEKTFGALLQDQPVLAVGEVRHQGEPVAIVVADTAEIARAAAARVLIEYETLPAVFDARRALEEEAPRVHPGGNLLSRFDIESGNLEEGFAGADVVVEDDFSVQRISPAYMEPENSLARCNPDGTITVWVSSQKPFDDQNSVALVLGLKTEQVQVVEALVGGAFGGREDAGIAVLTAVAAWHIRGTVQIVNRRSESFTAHPKRHPVWFHIKLGAKKDGTLTAVDIHADMDTGAYASYGPAVGSLLTEMAPGPYRCGNVRVGTNVVYTHSPLSGAMRGFGAPQAHFALESAMELLAEKLGMDPLALRRKNILHPGDVLTTQVKMDQSALSLPDCLDLMEAARERMKQIPPVAGKTSGVGCALAIQSMGLGAKVLDESANRLEWLPDGRVLVHLGAPDLGQGLMTVTEQMVAESLGLDFADIVTAPLDTWKVPNGGVTCGSRMTYLVGKAVLKAADMLKEDLLGRAALMLGVDRSQLSYQNGRVVRQNGESYPVREFTARLAETGEVIEAEARAEFEYPPEITPQHLPIGMPHIKFSFAGQVIRVEVDEATGVVEVKEVEAIHDLGRVINRTLAEGQIEGGIAMGIGYALYEDMPLKADGNWVSSFAEYLLPTALDAPREIRLHLLEIPEETGPYGAKGIAEISLVPTAPAIANAIHDACGRRVKHLPITAEKVLLGE